MLTAYIEVSIVLCHKCGTCSRTSVSEWHFVTEFGCLAVRSCVCGQRGWVCCAVHRLQDSCADSVCAVSRFDILTSCP